MQTFSDGLLTPAVSVVSAVEGIAVASPPVANSVVPISIVRGPPASLKGKKHLTQSSKINRQS